MIETSQLHTLVAVAKSRSFSKAAEELNVTQSAISQSIKNLETRIDVKLFKRTGKKVVLTPEGEKLYQLASEFLHQMTDTLDEIKHDKESMSGKIRIGTLTGLGKSWLSPQLLEVASKNRELDIHITLGFQEDLVREFNNYRLDILILPEDSLPQKGERVLIAEEKASLVYPKKGDYGIDQKITLEEFAQFPTVLFEHDDPLYMNWCRKKFGRVPRKVNAKFVVNSHGNMLMAVNMGIGVAVIPNHVLERSYYRDKVQTLGQNFEVSNGKFYLLHHKGALDFVRFRYVIDWLKNGPNPFNRPLKNT